MKNKCVNIETKKSEMKKKELGEKNEKSYFISR